MPGTEQLGAAGMTIGMKQYYSRKLLSRAKPKLVFLKYADKSGIPRNNGRSIEFRRYERPSATTTALTEGTAGAETRLTIANVQASVDQYGAWTSHSEVLVLQNYDPWIDNFSEVYGEHMAISLDTVARNVVTGGSTVQYAGGKGSRGDIGGTTGDRIDYAEIRNAVGTLENQDTEPFPELGNKFAGILSPYTKNDMFGDSDIINAFRDAYPRGPANPMQSGEIGDFYGVRWFVTSNNRVHGSLGFSGADVYTTTIFGRQYYGAVDYEAGQLGQRIIVNPVGSSGVYDPLHQQGSIGWKAALTCVRLNENWAVRIEHVVSQADEGV